MIYDVRQTTTCTYASPAAHARHVLRLMPINRNGQRVQVAALQTAVPGLHGSAAALSLARRYADWLRAQGNLAEAERCIGYVTRSGLGARADLPGPVGESNVYSLRPRGRVAAVGRTESGLLEQVGAILATGNIAVVEAAHPARSVLDSLPPELASRIDAVETLDAVPDLRAVLFDGDAGALRDLNRRMAGRDGPIIQVQAVSGGYDLDRLLEERSVSTNTAAAGGNASLMSVA